MQLSMQNDLCKAATDIAKGAGDILSKAYTQFEKTISTKSTAIDLVTQTDKRSETFIVEEIRKHFPTHAVLAEESGELASDGPYRWVVDPLDGTVNFAHRLPWFCVIIAVQEQVSPEKFETKIGVTYDPLRGELFCARKGHGATLNDQPIRVSETTRLIDAIGATGFMYDRLARDDDNHQEFCRLNLLTQGIRRMGSAGLDLVSLACGRFDFFWEYGLNPWDAAAGLLTVEEAGGVATDLLGKPADLFGPHLAASNRHLHQPLLAALLSSKNYVPASREGLAAFLPEELLPLIRQTRKTNVSTQDTL